MSVNGLSSIYLLIFFIFFKSSVFAVSSDQKVPKSFNVQGTIYESNGEPFIGVAAIKFQILDPAGQCVLYEETIPGIDTTAVHGSFSVNLGVTGNRVNNIDSSNILGTNIFENNRNVTVNGCGLSLFQWELVEDSELIMIPQALVSI